MIMPFTVNSPFPSVWTIAGHGVNCYLVCGSKRAVLVDAGWGFGNLAELVASLTALPVTVVNTHGHPDHTYGDTQFTDVFISSADQPLATSIATPDTRRKTLARVSARGPLPEDFVAETWINAHLPTLQVLPENAAFDLGGRILQVIPTPGHTPGSVCLLDAGARLLFTGDTVVAGTVLMFLEHALPLRVYAESLRRLLLYQADIESLLPGHGNEPLPVLRITELHEAATAILQGDVVGEFEQTHLGEAYCAHFPTCTICYNPDRLE